MSTTFPLLADERAASRGRRESHANEIVDLLQGWTRVQPLWDAYVRKHPKGCVFHTSEMVQVYQATKNHVPLALASIRPDGKIAALLVSVRVQTLPQPTGRLSSRAIFYAEPLCHDHPDSMLALAELIAQHDALMKRSVLFAEVRPLFAPGCERTVLERAGYAYMEYLNYLYDVSQAPEAIWADLHKSAHRAIRSCERRGLTVREVPVDEAVEHLYPLLMLSFGHSGVPFADRSLFDAAAHTLHPSGMVKFFAAYEGSKPVAMDVTLMFKDQMYLWYNGVERSAQGSPCSLLRWFELKWAHDNGFTICDSGGAGRPNVPYGVRDFKRKFGGALVQFGRYRKVFAPWTLALAEKIYQLRRSIVSQK